MCSILTLYLASNFLNPAPAVSTPYYGRHRRRLEDRVSAAPAAVAVVAEAAAEGGICT